MRKDKLAVCHKKSTPKTDLHCTPKAFFEYLQKQFKVKFTIDIAASAKNAMCRKFIDEKKDTLKSTWQGIAWCNPPYSKAKEFVAHCLENAQHGNGSTFMLLAARTDRAWWIHTKNAYAIVYIKGRLKFAGAPAGAPFPSVVIVFKKGYKGKTQNIYLSPTPYERGFSRGKPK